MALCSVYSTLGLFLSPRCFFVFNLMKLLCSYELILESQMQLLEWTEFNFDEGSFVRAEVLESNL